MFVPFGGIADRQGGVRNYNKTECRNYNTPLELTTKLPYLKTKSRGLPRLSVYIYVLT